MVLTPQMRQVLKIVQMPILELKNYIAQELEENPVLEVEEGSPEQVSGDIVEKLMRIEERTLDEDLHRNKQSDSFFKELAWIDSPTLQEYLLKQLKFYFSEKDLEYKTGELIVENIDEDGYLQASSKELWEMSKKDKSLASSNLNISLQDIERMISFIQKLEPRGIAARNLRECLLLQLKSSSKQGLALKIVDRYLMDLSRGRFKFIASSLGVTIEEVKAAAKTISSLEPFPGRVFFKKTPQIFSGHPPDIVIEKDRDKGYNVIINYDYIPSFKINQVYRRLLKDKKVSPETKQYIRQKINSALTLIRAIGQRQKTISRVVEELISIQEEFFKKEDFSYLKPLTLKELAQRVGRDESTISRVIRDKYVKTSFGIFRLSQFFTRYVKDVRGGKISRELVKLKIFNIVNEENQDNPHTDVQITKILKREGINIARRTVAKYREELKINPAHLRRKKI